MLCVFILRSQFGCVTWVLHSLIVKTFLYTYSKIISVVSKQVTGKMGNYF